MYMEKDIFIKIRQDIKDTVAQKYSYPNGEKCKNWNSFFTFYSDYKQKYYLTKAIDEIIELCFERKFLSN